MDVNETQTNTTTEVEMELVEAMKRAFFTWLKTIFYFIVLPYKIWKASTMRLAKLSGKEMITEKEEFPMYTFNLISTDAAIFMLGIISVPLVLFFGAGLLIYFFVIPAVSFIKEVITMSLVTVKKLEIIAENTKK
jgi:membrane protein insertase Oxa1/YidC/SpoIIIJ